MSSGNIDLQMAIADLNASRARLRDVLMPPPPDPNAPKSKGVFGGLSDSVSSLWNSFKSGKGGPPAVMLAVDAVQSWWATHPWRQIGNSVAAPLGVAALPLVRRYPWAAVIVASVAGALFIKTRPWRWRLVAQQAHVVRRQAVRWALSQATKPAVQALVATAIASMMSNLNQKKSGDATAGAGAGAGAGASDASTTPPPVRPTAPASDHGPR